MVMSFFRKGDGEAGLDAVAQRTVSMMADARHSFDLANACVLSGADAESVAADIRSTDDRINRAEQELRGDLVTHVAVRGSFDIAAVLSYTLLIKKIERIGDQAKNILDLAEEGVDLVGAEDVSELNDLRRIISGLMGETADLLIDADPDDVVDFRDRVDTLRRDLETNIRALMHSPEPGSWAVPRAILLRYWKRIVANLGGIITSITEPLQQQDYLDDGGTDITDD